ncbi:hypothetical protein [Azospirillum himalayense]|uniref:Lactate permease n=1 Tax=Azospirillum himalayense TaxID=654847 RepID=A0ABW0GFJ2_9PROT
MNESVERFRRKRAILAAAGLSPQHSVHLAPLTQAESVSACGLPAVLPGDVNQSFVAVDAEALLAEIHGKLDSEKIGALVDACQQECLQAIIRPLGLARALFNDKDGGNVDTVHNARNKVYATDAEREKYNEHTRSNEYNDKVSHQYHHNKGYTENNAKSSAAQKADGVVDAYTGKVLRRDDKKDQDHVVSGKEVHEDRGRVLAEVDGVALANSETNLKPTSRTLNRSKQDRTAENFIKYVEEVKIPNLQKDIAALEAKPSLTPDEQRILADHKRQLQEFQSLDKEKLRAADAAARKEINGKINKAYYTSKKFIKNTAVTSATEGGKMALQQAIGVLMEEFVRAAFAEVKDVWRNGFKGKVDDTFLDALKLRLMRVADRVQAKWKHAAVAFRDGFISGFLSNLITVVINAFVTTSARWVRITREGFMSLYRALKTLAFPPEGMSLAEAADAASKLMMAGVVTGGGILLEEIVEKKLQATALLAPIAPYVSAITVGVATGLCTVLAIHLLDRLDLFGVNAKIRHEHVMAKLDETISHSYTRAREAAAAFDPPPLLHLT